MSTERNACIQFNQHAWKKNICTNCSKHLSCHNSNVNLKSGPSNANAKPSENKANHDGHTDDTIKSGSQNSKPCKPKKPSVNQSNATKSLGDVASAKVGNEESINLNQDSKTTCSLEQSKSNSNYYQIYDISAKGQSGKPLDIDSRDGDSSSERDVDSSNTCLMATPYTVVDVITIALEKSRQATQTGSDPPRLPSTPAPDVKKGRPNKMELSISKELLKPEIDDQVTEDFDSLHNYHPRLYEEIDESFLERVANRKLEMQGLCEDNVVSCQMPNDDNKITTSASVAKTIDPSENKLPEINQKTIQKLEKSKKSGGKSFFQKLLGKGNKEEESVKIKVDKKEKKESSVDDKSLASIEEDARKSSESLLTNDSQVKKEDVSEIAAEKTSVPEMLNQSSCIAEDFAKEIEEKFETLSRKSNFNKANAMARSTSNKIENSFDPGEKSQLTSSELGNASEEGISMLPNRKSILVTSTRRPDYSNNRKSMTPAEAKLARKMLVAPPPPPICTSSTSLASNSSCSKDDVSSSSAKPLPSYFMSLQRKPDSNHMSLQRKPDSNHMPSPAVTPHSPAEDVFESSEMMNRNSLMDDLDEILKKGGMAQVTSSTLPRSFLQNLDKATEKSMTTGRVPSKEIEISVASNSLQQRALPELPQLPPPTSQNKYNKQSLSPESENLYEILPHSDEPSSPKKINVINSKSDKSKISTKIIGGNINPNFNSDLNQTISRPRPAPRAAIRTVGVTKAKEINNPLKPNEESYANENEVFQKSKSSYSLRLNEAFEDKCSLVSKTTLQSLQVYLEKFCTPPPLILFPENLFSKISWKQKEIEIVKVVESKNCILSWMKAVFYEITINDVNCILMVRRGSVITSPLPKYNHLNLINSLHSFEAHAQLQDCQRFFQAQLNDKNAEKSKYIFDILPYSKISVFPLFVHSAANNSLNESPLLSYDISKFKVFIMLQLFDSLLHLQRLGIDLYRLYPSDVLMVAPLQNAKSLENADNTRSCLMPVLVPTEYAEHTPRNDQKLLCHDLTKITSLIMSTMATVENNRPDLFIKEETKISAQPDIQAPQPRARQTSISLDKNDRCLRKVERILTNGDSWSQIQTAINYLELSLWGPTSEDEIRQALTSHHKREIFEWWIGISRSEILVSLMRNPLASTIPQTPTSGKIDKDAHSCQTNKLRNIGGCQELLKDLNMTSLHVAIETTRKAEFLGRCELETLLATAKELFF